jgi:antitoxin VapB
MIPRSRDGRADVPRRAKVFWTGRSQAVRLPKEFRFEDDEVAIRREGDRVILEPIRARKWPKGYWDRLRELTKGLAFPDVEPLPGGHDRPGPAEW